MVELDLMPKTTFEVSRHVLLGQIIAEKEINRKTAHSMFWKSRGSEKEISITDLTKNAVFFKSK